MRPPLRPAPPAAGTFVHPLSAVIRPTLPDIACRADGQIKDKDATDFKNKIYFSRVMAERLQSGGLAIGGFFVLVSFAVISFQMQARVRAAAAAGHRYQR